AIPTKLRHVAGLPLLRLRQDHPGLAGQFAQAKARLALRKPSRIRRLFPVPLPDHSSVSPARPLLVRESARVAQLIELITSYGGYPSIRVIQSFTLRRSRPCVDLRLKSTTGSEGRWF